MDTEAHKIRTKKVIVSGIVQGVGFRPLTFRVAKKNNIVGTVQNIGGMVEIVTQSSEENFQQFLYDLQTADCEGCEIIKIQISDISAEDQQVYPDFKIIESTANREVSIIPPDLATCDRCLGELYEKGNRRFFNPFISCMSCGPRYTIMDVLPYDRDTTTMVDFPMCEGCNEEYVSPESRRFHAQTISCHDCGPYLILKEYNKRSSQEEIQAKEWRGVRASSLGRGVKCINQPPRAGYKRDENRTEPCEKPVRPLNSHQVSIYKSKKRFERAVRLLKRGGILAVKGIGGYHFVCSPFLEETVQKLRQLKGREEKPFAVMFESVADIRQHCHVSPQEEQLLKSKARPIVLLYSQNEQMAPSTYKASIYCGAFLPYTPLQTMLVRACGPLIMTSGNISDQPIIREDSQMLALDSPLLDGILYNKRRILRSVDDSVAKIIDGKPQLIRRSRGYVPYPVFLPEREDNLKIFAAGGDLKASFCLYNRGSAVVSQYFGDLEEGSVLAEYRQGVADLSRLLKIQPELTVCDLHPNYFSTKFTEAMDRPLLYVQHHHAHVASVMAEHHLNDDKVIGIAFDGTGYGLDGHIWGSEFMICQGADFQRLAHLKYTTMLGGDGSMKDAKKTATCFLLGAGLEQYVSDERKTLIQAALTHGVNTIQTSSVGRLFDAVSSILDIRQENQYEGECAAYLEKEALLAEKSGVAAVPMAFGLIRQGSLLEIDAAPVLEVLCGLEWDQESGQGGRKRYEDQSAYLLRRQALALGFHYALAEVVLEVCRLLGQEQQTNKVAFSGGVFQNCVLTQRVLQLLERDGFSVYYNEAVPPNDGCISLGQIFVGIMNKDGSESVQLQSDRIKE
ncbi:carbamoyltransferase HypF [Aminipila butyrica]|uniref:Carbamoyltransferase n=1 Tax=Aminipila butyrica TaxID=433296 RepID=A0A858BYT3_9FIRM|nr:carbamoyltransferase HypF [Aminipila butyrica]QIB69226.1 carbamoyltransferase HypF [Aminipila butyrica]